MDGYRWSIEFAEQPNQVSDFNTLIGKDSGEIIAVNDSQRTWFRLRSRSRLAIDPSLFSFGLSSNEVSKIRCKVEPRASSREGGPDELEPWRVTFSYRIKTRVGSEFVRGRVWGELRVWTKGSLNRASLPWIPLDLDTGLPTVDESLRRAIAEIDGVPVQTETEVSRQLGNGAVLHLVIKRRIGTVIQAVISPGSFQVPIGYREEEPVIGVPGR
jgi:hypothetical protein